MKEKKYVAQVIVNHTSLQMDKIFDYKIPEHLLEIIKEGMRVMVPFGMGNKKLEAYVLNIKTAEEELQYPLKELLYPIEDEPILNKKQIKLIVWLKNKYLCKYIDAIHCILPAGIVNIEKKIVHLIEEDWKKSISSNAKNQVEFLDTLESLGGKSTLDKLYSRLSIKNLSTVLKLMEEKNMIKIDYEVSSRVKIQTQQYAKLNLKETEIENIINSLKNAKRQQEIILFLKQHKMCTVKELMDQLKVTRAPLNTLVEKGYVVIIEKEYKRDPYKNVAFENLPKMAANLEQNKVIQEITADIHQEKTKTFLIHGITGSGKTEIYLQLMEEVLKKGKQGIILVPEIALTPQTVERFYGRFGDGIAVLHSNLSEGERFDEWRKIIEEKVNIVIGARSAIFAPFKNLGMIIIDEEHEHTYKSETNPKYHAVEVANYRSREEDAIVVLGSATPSMESYYKASKGEFSLFTLTKRATNALLPEVEVIDMKNELDEGNKGILSRRLYFLIQENLKNKKQTILFLNRRGYATFISCPQCGYVVKCRRCDITMTYHKTMKNLQCHYCGEKEDIPKVCPSCSDPEINYFGVGTQKIESLIASYFPEAVISRMDMDSTSVKGSHQRILEDFKKEKIDILIGTQMISKGLDFPNVTLVGIIAADATLNLPDFRASERTFQLVTQVAGRAGRGLEEGRVVLQTHSPEHYSIFTASKHDYNSFYKEELNLRKEFLYPPFVQLIHISFSSKNLDEVYTISQKITNNIKYILKAKGYTEYDEVVLGPNPAMIAKIKEKYRYQILLKDHGVPYTLLKSIVKYLLIDHRQKFVSSKVTVGIDIDPLYIM
ncbi:primosomal protein N' [Clostridium aceticum]|uniref:Replication restart protein PriA n=1 Tax=Clostridium aceticum TaxID=84022 RepID=A0A0D8IA32_9CLOT|nr:primosomal protein N' [Clostridium aceticum]AKL95542.1 primosomal protein N' [Clostridium aceticum]KJF26877.1 primosomal protein N' [Clostridium aceticum]